MKCQRHLKLRSEGNRMHRMSFDGVFMQKIAWAILHFQLYTEPKDWTDKKAAADKHSYTQRERETIIFPVSINIDRLTYCEKIWQTLRKGNRRRDTHCLRKVVNQRCDALILWYNRNCQLWWQHGFFRWVSTNKMESFYLHKNKTDSISKRSKCNVAFLHIQTVAFREREKNNDGRAKSYEILIVTICDCRRTRLSSWENHFSIDDE